MQKELTRLLCCRLSLFVALIAVYPNMTPTNWLLLQLNGFLKATEYYHIMDSFSGLDILQLRDFWMEQSSLFTLLTNQSRISIILDEAQVLATKEEGKFRSADGTEERPLLSPVLRTLSELNKTDLLIGGTSMRLKDFDLVGSGILGKGSGEHKKVLKLSSFTLAKMKEDVRGKKHITLPWVMN